MLTDKTAIEILRAIVAEADKDQGGDKAHHDISKAIIIDARLALAKSNEEGGDKPRDKIMPWAHPVRADLALGYIVDANGNYVCPLRATRSDEYNNEIAKALNVYARSSGLANGIYSRDVEIADLRARLKDAEDDVLRLHNEKMKFFERVIELERELAGAKAIIVGLQGAESALLAEKIARSATAGSIDPFNECHWVVQYQDGSVHPELFEEKHHAEKFIVSDCTIPSKAKVVPVQLCEYVPQSLSTKEG